MKRVTITVPDELEAAIAAYQDSEEAPPTLTALVQAALEDFLALRGFATRPRVLRISPAPHGSGSRDGSIEHDRELWDP